MYPDLINAFSRIIRLSESEQVYLCSLFTEKTFHKGDHFLQEGQVCREAGFIRQGLVRYYINSEGEDRVYGFGQEYNFVCNYESFLDHSPSQKNIQCIENTEMLILSYANLQLLYRHIAEGEKFGRLMCEQIFVESLRQLTSLYTQQPEERYLRFLETYPDLQQRIPQYYISSYVGVKPQSLSRIRKRLSAG
ncbi:Crp/Fnr family transcriptional regulator [Deminuibacter soli]|uniref:Crp/Fnr family transcriptional regulator n=1 Tax=Deminuibacter soli TaxID=2291815 RepID=A0A3E1NKH7_9BACT|nr:Crp/Fnr family transcriptional regulator [Deminuibacter soli]RFM28288.1 Crp/Fnr family transcriptional regulator [Deminuibacter soli]